MSQYVLIYDPQFKFGIYRYVSVYDSHLNMYQYVLVCTGMNRTCIFQASYTKVPWFCQSPSSLEIFAKS
jgi:hypothetical protein